MPTVRRFRSRSAREVHDWRYYRLRDEPIPLDVRAAPPWELDWPLEDEWREQQDEIVRAWVRARPGTRPAHWWALDAPDEPRRRVGGTGWEYSRAVPEVEPTEFRGLPGRWWTGSAAEFVTKCYPPPRVVPGAVPYDPNDPPTFEAEGVYLERLGLLLPGERVTDREPEVCPVEPFLSFFRTLRESRR